jgi:hypothetical protein
MYEAETITVKVELPEDVHVSTREYQASHGHPANVFGSWGFQYEGGAETEPDGLDSDGYLWIKGTLADAIEELPEGDWNLLP